MNAESTSSKSPNSDPNAGLQSPRLRRVLKLSRVFRIICWIMMAGLILAAIGVSIPQIQKLFTGGDGDAQTPQQAFFPAALFLHAWWFAAIWFLERMFRSFSTNGVFHPSGARYLKWLGFWFLLSGCIPLVLGMFSFAIGNLRASEIIAILAPASSPALLGAIILMIGWILEEACELRAEQELTI